MSTKKEKNILEQALDDCRGVFWLVLLFSAVINLLMIALPIYSLQVLNRVLSSGSYVTLWMLTLIVSAMFVALAIFNSVRSFTLTKLSEWLDNKLSPTLLSMSITSATTRSTVSGSQNLRDLSTIKNFVTGAGLISLFDTPWAIIYLLVVFVIHVDMGLLTLTGATVLFVLAIFNEYATRKPLEEANEISVRSLAHAEIATRNAEAVEAMGMSEAIIKQWHNINNNVQKLQILASNRAGIIMSVTKFFRLIIQLLVLGLGVHLVLQNEITAGAIIACSILASRALSPFETAITAWKTIIDARKSYDRLMQNINVSLLRERSISLPEPKGILTIENVVFYHPSQPTRPILKGLSFGLLPGETCAIIGPSASGKSTLAKLIVGVWKTSAGKIRLDNADVYSWNRDEFGKYVGYVPQDVELFKGSVKENIARMQEDAKDEDIVKAAQLAGAHEMILRLPNGYETDIGIAGNALSGGQRQRVALARAFFGNPKLIVLDEPNANLDDAGEAALTQAILNARANKITTIIISHRQSILSVVDKLLVVKEGLLETFGPAKEVIAAYAAKAEEARKQQQQISKPQQVGAN